MTGNKPPHLMTKDELDYALFKMTGIKPIPPSAPQKEHDDHQRLLKIRLDLLNAEKDRRIKSGTWQAD